MTDQPELMEVDELNLPACLAPGEHTATTAVRDRELVRAAAKLLVAGHSQRHIAARLGVCRKTLRAMIPLLESSGEMPPLKRRLSVRLGETLEAMLEDKQELQEGEKVSFNGLDFGILFDKKALLDGDPTARIEHTSGPGLEDLKRDLANVVDVSEVPTPDSESGVTPLNTNVLYITDTTQESIKPQ